MLSAREKDNRREDISGLALALLSDRCFIDLFFGNENNSPHRKLRAGQPLLAKKQITSKANKDFFIRRF